MRARGRDNLGADLDDYKQRQQIGVRGGVAQPSEQRPPLAALLRNAASVPSCDCELGAGRRGESRSAALCPSFPGPNYPASNSSGYEVGMGGAARPSYQVASDPLPITGSPLPPGGIGAPPAAPMVPLNASDLARQVASGGRGAVRSATARAGAGHWSRHGNENGMGMGSRGRAM